MSEIRDKLWFAEHGHKLEADTLRMMVSDLLAELERMENSLEAECMECEKLACTEIRQQAAREAVEIVGSGGWCNEELEVAIKAHFKLQEAPK